MLITRATSRASLRRLGSRAPTTPKSALRLFGSGSTRTSRTVRARGVDFHVEVCNPSAPHPVLCLPGALGTASSDFGPQLRGGLGPEFRVVAPDPRGLGSSRAASAAAAERDYPPDFYTRDALDAAAVMEALGHDRYSVLGWSDGANAALHLAASEEAGVRVRAAAVWGGNAYVTEADAEAWEAVRDVSAWSERAREEKARVHGGVERLQRLNNMCTDAWVRMLKFDAGDVCLGELHRIKCPTLVLHGAKDVICDVRHARYIARHISDASLIVLPQGKHNIHQRHADAFHTHVRSFLLDALNDDVSVRTETITDEEEQPAIDEIAYAFMGSKALFVALGAGVFDAIDRVTSNPISNGSASFEQVEELCDGVSGERLHTLLSACVALKLIRRKVRNGRDAYSLPTASHEQLVRTSKRYWGDYISGQVDDMFFRRMVDLDDTMRTGGESSHGYESWFESDPDAARRYTRAQHNGSLATAHALHRRLPDLADRFPSMRLLDVGGGSGAFSIATVRRVPGARAVVLDLPSVTGVAEEIIAEEADASVRDRLSTLALSATSPGEWRGVVGEGSFDVVLMSYVSGSIPAAALPGLYRNAFRALRPGGWAIVHDFFVDNGGDGPKSAALWALAHVTVNPEGMGLRPNRIVELLSAEGFVAPKAQDLIPGATQTIVAVKPGA